jgi:trimeric autotransporter adhesin
MKRLYFALIIMLPLAACKKEATDAVVNVQSTSPAPAKKVTTITNSPVSADTLADRSMVNVAMVLDSTNSDETALLFVKTANPAYDGKEDGKYFQGFGLESLASLTSDGIPVAINARPYTPGQPIPLYVGARNNGSYFFRISYERTIPGNMQVWIRDNLVRDSLNLRNGNYAFTINKADSTSFGSNRFQLVLRAAH